MTEARPDPNPSDSSAADDPRMRGFRRRADVETVLALLEERVSALPAESIVATGAIGRVLAADVDAAHDVPTFDRAAMDGYAVIAEDTFGASEYNPLSLEVIGESMPGAGCDAAAAVGRGQCVRIMTGAPVPAGADAVLPFERTRVDDAAVNEKRVEILGAVTPGKHIGRAGEDVRHGEPLLTAGRRLRPQDLGVLAATGVASVSVVQQPTAALFVTGNELIPAGGTPEGSSIVDSNSPMLEALIARDGGAVIESRIVRDERDVLRAALAEATADVVIVTGGSSVGREDHAPSLVRELGELAIHGIAMRPSSPAGVGFLPPAREESGRERPVFLVPGNPVSALCAYEFFAGPTLRALGGRSREWPHRRVRLPLASKLTSQSGRVDYARVRRTDVDGQPHVEPLMVSGASILSSTTRADGVVIVPRDREGLAEGTEVEVFLYD